MYKSLNIKLVLMLVVFIISVMTTVGVFLLNNVFSFYEDDFVSQIEDGFSDSVEKKMKENLLSEHYAKAQKELLLAYAGTFGFDQNRVFYILDMSGNVLTTSAITNGEIEKTSNILSAMNKKTAKTQILGADYMDYAIFLQNSENECIFYVKDNLIKMKKLSGMLFTIIIQALLVGLTLAVIMSFFLAKAITLPIQNLTKGTIKIAKGEYSHRLSNYSKDEIGVLTKNFNSMAQVIENTLMQVSGEREKLKTILDCLEDAVAAFDENGLLLHINPQITKMLSIKDDGEKRFEDFTKKLDTPNITMGIVKALDNTLTVSEQKICETKNRELIVDIGFTVFSYDMKKTGYIIVIRNVTERSLLEKSRREFIANVSHELRTPLTSIKGATETILSDDDMPPTIRTRFLSIVSNEADRMTRIVKDLLVLSRLDNRRMTWKMSNFSIEKSVSQICEALQTEAKFRSQKLTFELQISDEKTIYADKERIEQVLTNIIGNAIKYTPNCGSIGVFLSLLDEDSIKICVVDTGIGIPEEDLPHLFERFYRVDKSRNSDAGGTGLGLSIAKDIIDAHGGKISVESLEGKGTAITIILPMVSNIISD